MKKIRYISTIMMFTALLLLYIRVQAREGGPSAPGGEEAPALEEWKQAYLEYLEGREDADGCTYSLIYVDGDEIPELLIDTGFEAGGCQILTFHDHVLNEWQSNRLNVTYIERGNLICNSDGNMGYYYDAVYTIRDGEWVYVDGGTWGDGPNGPQQDENGELIYVYHWSGEDVSEEEYGARLNAVYPTEQGVYPRRYYILDEIRSLLETGSVASAGHRYQLIREDVTWKEARALCRRRGGYLATLTSWEEFERVQAQMLSEGQGGVTFFVGARNERAEGVPFGYRWLEPGTEYGYKMLDQYNALWGFWLKGEPSYRGLTESGEEVDEEYVVLFYRSADGRCYINDVPDNILEAAPFYAGRVGYICEFEKHRGKGEATESTDTAEPADAAERQAADMTKRNIEFFESAAGALGLSEAETAQYWRILCADDVFRRGTGRLTAFLTGDFDNNGQEDMAAMIHEDSGSALGYGAGSVYIYMNEDGTYRFQDDEFPFISAERNQMGLSGGDLDHDGVTEILLTAQGTGNGGAGDWYGRILKYEAQEVFPYEDRETGRVGSNMRGLFDMRCIEYQGGYAIQASEFLSGEGGNIHIVAKVDFILAWDGKGGWLICGEWKIADVVIKKVCK